MLLPKVYYTFLIVMLSVTSMLTRFSAVRNDVSRHELLNGTIIYILPGSEIRLRLRDMDYMRALLRNMSLVDNDQIERGGHMIYSVEYENGVRNPASAVGGYVGTRQFNMTNVNHNRVAKRSAVLWVQTFASPNFQNKIEEDTYYGYGVRYTQKVSTGLKSQWWVPYCSECVFTWWNDGTCWSSENYMGYIDSQGGRSSASYIRCVTSVP
ncbi:hypothetical protein V1506DRAFT_544021 [Lipomyces tetrasporus]